MENIMEMELIKRRTTEIHRPDRMEIGNGRQSQTYNMNTTENIKDKIKRKSEVNKWKRELKEEEEGKKGKKKKKPQ